MDTELHAGRVFERIKQVYGLETDSDLARFLDLSRQAVSTARTRGTMEWRTVIEKCRDQDLTWIFWGRHSTPEIEAAAITAELGDIRAVILRMQSELEELRGGGRETGH